MRFIRNLIIRWTPPQLTPEQEIVVGREIASKGRNAYASHVLNVRQSFILFVGIICGLALAIRSLPLPISMIIVVVTSLHIGSRLYVAAKCLKWADGLLFKYAAHEAAKYKGPNKGDSSIKPDAKKPYSGELTIDQAFDGMNAALRNANRLAQDSKILLDAGRYPSAVALAILAIEEWGKVNILRQVVGHNDAIALRKGWEAYRDHRRKIEKFLPLVAAAQGAKTHIDVDRFLREKAGEPKEFDILKQDCLYTSCWGGGFVEPEKVFTRQHAEGMVVMAQAMIGERREIVRREIELFVKHIIEPALQKRVSDVRGYVLALANEALSGVSPEQIDAYFAGSQF